MKATVIYDGACNLCAGNLKWLRRLDWLGKLEARPYQDEAVYARFPQLKREECEQAMQVVLADGRTFAGAEALREVFLRLPLTCPLGVLLFLSPLMGLAKRIYRHIAAHRYEISGSCEVKRHEDDRK
jgi:predicted DCC family thiol-disulfide oxidoreductase YuxK